MIFNSHRYDIISGNTNNTFRIDSNGSIFTNNNNNNKNNIQLDYKTTQQYQLKISATDNGIPPLSTLTIVKIYVTDSNDHPPIFDKSVFFFNVTDTHPLGSSVGICPASDLDTKINGELHYRIVSGDYGYFSMDSATGELFLDKKLDCRTICAFYMTITASDHGKPSALETNATVVINILPTTEPILFNHQYSVEIPYNISVNTQIATLKIKAPSYVFSPRLYFSILNHSNNNNNININNLFRVDSNGAVSSCMTIPNTINYILLKIRVSRIDNGCMNDDTEIATINITIIREKNNKPVFQITPVFYVSESSKIGSTVGRIRLSNNEERQVIYSLTHFPSHVFILKENGLIFLRQQLDFESKREHQIEIEASISGKPHLKTKQMVYIFVKDSNDNRPEFMTPLNRIVTVFIKNCYPEMIAQMRAFDRDSEKSGQLSYSLDSDHHNSASDIFWINQTENSLWIINNKNMSFNHEDAFEVGITVTDHGVPSLNQSITIKIIFLEINTEPRFVKHNFKINIEENRFDTRKSHHVFKYEDKDKALLNRQRNTFQIIDDESSSFSAFDYFSIGNTSGILQQLRSFDRERIHHFTFYVALLDGDREVDRATVNVNILDLNDSPPVIVQDQQGFLEENQLVKASEITFKASDADIGMNGKLRYRILTRQSDFKIDIETGVVTATRTFDYETQDRYNLQIQVNDSAPPYYTAVGNLSIFIQDLNDNPPRFSNDLIKDVILSDKSLSPGTYITTLTATDADTEINSKHEFSIINNCSYVDIDKHSGVISLTQRATNISTSLLTIHAKVLDSTNPALNPDFHTMRIQFTNDSFPVLNDTSTRLVRIVENEARFIHEPFHQIHLGEDLSDAIFHIDSHNKDQFKVNKTTGEIYLRRTLDYEENQWHDVWVCVSTIEKPKIRTCSKTVVIVDNTNDNLPYFKEKQIEFHIKENVKNVTIGRIAAFDVEENDPIFYHLDVSGILQGFAINHTSGNIFRADCFDFEHTKKYNFTVFASNYPRGDTWRNASLNVIHVQVVVLDQNEAPFFIDPPTTIVIGEEYLLGKTFFTFQVQDPDESSVIIFNVDDGLRNSTVQISTVSGELYLKQNIDREIIGSNHSIVIAASDGEFTVYINVTLVITDVNNSPPRFSSDHFLIEFREDASEESRIFQFKTIDEDQGVNARSEIFFVDHTERAIRDRFVIHTNGSLCITQNSYFQITGKPLEFNFTIQARNIVSPFYVTSSKVTIRISDVNNHAPVFGELYYTSYLQADAKVGQFVATVNATDNKDLDLNAKISYEIVGGNGSSYFQIDQEEGHVTVHMSLRKFSNQKLILIIRAVDEGSPPLDSTCTINLTIEQINQHAPQVMNEPYSIDLYENHQTDRIVVQIGAHDVESGTNLIYHITNQLPSSNIIVSNQQQWKIFNNGSLVLCLPLDYERKTNFTLHIKITDGSVCNSKSTQTIVSINVLDVNEPPVFQLPQHQQQLLHQQLRQYKQQRILRHLQQQKQQDYQISIPENFNTSNPILKIQASDPDSDTIIYTLADSANGSFVIGPNTGNIYSLVSFDYENKWFYQLLIEASDNGIPPQKSNITFLINITGVNEYWPHFEADSYTFDIASHQYQNIGQSIGNVRAIDMDLGKDGECIYKIASPPESGFRVNSSTGTILVSRRSLREVTTFTVLALNKYRQDYFDSAHVQVTVVDFTGRPFFEKSQYQVYAKENIRENTSIAQFQVSHYDGDNIIYGISDDNNVGNLPFDMDQKTGDLYLLSPLDFEQTTKYEFRIEAVYKNYPKGHAQVQINILDTNDNFPIPIHPCSGNLTENSLPGLTIIPEIIITDADSSPNAGPFQFSLLDNKDKFMIDVHTGSLQSRVAFDRETMGLKFNISVGVHDNGSPSLGTTFQCIVHITDANDNEGVARHVKIILTDDSYRDMGIGDISPIDIDTSSHYNCSMKRSGHFFNFDSNSCFLRMAASSSEIYTNKEIMISYFGQHGVVGKPIECIFNTEKRALSYEHFSNSVPIFIHNTSIHAFLSFMFEDYESYINREFSNKLQSSPSIFIGAVKNFKNGVIVVLVITNPSARNQALLQYHLKNMLEKSQIVTTQESNFKLFDACAVTPCEDKHTMCKAILEFDGYTILNTPKLIFHTRNVFVKTQCQCSAGFVGIDCSETPVRCSDIPCQNEGKCTNTENGFHCRCNKYFMGEFCQFDVNECLLSSPCKHGSTCVNKYGGFICVCDQNHESDLCEKVKSPCSSNPCLNNGACIIDQESETGFKCQCQFGDWGSKCESQSWNFSPMSYLEVLGNYSLMSIAGFEISGDFASVDNDFLLFMFNDPTRFTFFVESVAGKLRAVIATNRTTILVGKDSGKSVSDGIFHSFKIRIDNVVSFL